MAYGQSFYSSGGGGGIPPQLQTDMNTVFNKKFGTTGQSYPSTDWAKEVNLMGLLPEKTVSGSVASFSDGADDVPIKTATFNIDPTLDGVSAVKVVRTGKNLLPYTLATIKAANSGTWSDDNKLTVNGITYEVVADSNGNVTDIIVSGTATANAQLWLIQSSGYANYPSGTLNGVTGGSNTTYWFDMMAEGSGNVPVYDGDVTFNPTQKYRPRVIVRNGCAITGEIHIKPMLRKTGDATYEPYSATTRTISLGQTVYGGSVTVDEDGECELEKTYAMVDLGDLTYNYSSDRKYFITTTAISGIKIPPSTSVPDWLCDFFTIDSGSNIYQYATDNDEHIGCANSGKLMISHQALTDPTDFKTFVTGKKLVFELATPTTSTLTPITPITSALGVNNIWCDTGDVESLTYRANNKSVLQFDYISDNAGVLYNRLGGTDIIKPIFSFTADGDVTFKYKGVRIYTDTGSDEGFFAFRKNGTVVYKQNLTTGATAQYTNIPSIDLETGDTVEFCIGFDGTHSGCTFTIYSLT